MIVGLAEDPNAGFADFLYPAARQIGITRQENPFMPTAFGDNFWVAYVLAALEVLVMYNEAKACLSQCVR